MGEEVDEGEVEGQGEAPGDDLDGHGGALGRRPREGRQGIDGAAANACAFAAAAWQRQAGEEQQTCPSCLAEMGFEVLEASEEGRQGPEDSGCSWCRCCSPPGVD